MQLASATDAHPILRKLTWLIPIAVVAVVLAAGIFVIRPAIELQYRVKDLKSRMAEGGVTALIKAAPRLARDFGAGEGRTFYQGDRDMPRELSDWNPSWLAVGQDRIVVMLIGGHIALHVDLGLQPDGTWNATAFHDEKEIPLRVTR